jgi:hypothetical protein
MPAQSLDELVAQFDEAIVRIPELILKQTEQAALGALALVDLRITERGVSATGQPFEDYTPAYKRRKKEAGRYRNKVDFQLTGQMLASTASGFERIGPTERSVNGGRAKVKFEGRDDTTRKKLAGNNKYRPGFLNPSKEEIKTVTRVANKGLSEDIAAIFQ